jgi:hypothetical protein
MSPPRTGFLLLTAGGTVWTACPPQPDSTSGTATASSTRHQHARGQQALHTATCVPLLEFDEASVPVLDIGGRTAECQQCRAMIWPDEASRGHAKGRSCSYEAVFPIPPPQPLRDLLTSKPAPCARLPLVHASPLPPYLFASTSGNTIPPCRWPPLALTSSHPQMGSV